MAAMHAKWPLIVLGCLICSFRIQAEDPKPEKSWFDSVSESVQQASAKAWEATKEKSGQVWEATKEKSAPVWEATKEKSGQVWEATKEKSGQVWEATKEKSAPVWEATKEKSGQAWEATKEKSSEFYSKYESEINEATALAAALGTAYLIDKYGGSSGSQTSDRSAYSEIRDPASVGPGKLFTPAQRQQILDENMRRNSGVLRSDLSGNVLTIPGRYEKGYSPSPNEAQVDHIFPRSTGGTNSFGNAQVLSREENLAKGASVQPK